MERDLTLLGTPYMPYTFLNTENRFEGRAQARERGADFHPNRPTATPDPYEPTAK